MREPRKNLRRAALVMLTRCDAVNGEVVQRIEQEVDRIAKSLPIARTVHAPLELLNEAGRTKVGELHGRPVAAFCGIGNPQAFQQTLIGLGADVNAFREFPDHHPYTRDDVDDLRRWAADLPADTWIATTQKDWVKLRLSELGGRPLWAVRVGLQFVSGKDVFDRAVLNAARKPVAET